MSQLNNVWTMHQFRHKFEAVVAAATRAPQLITSRGVPAYVLVPERKGIAKKFKSEEVVTLHKLQRPREK